MRPLLRGAAVATAALLLTVGVPAAASQAGESPAPVLRGSHWLAPGGPGRLDAVRDALAAAGDLTVQYSSRSAARAVRAAVAADSGRVRHDIAALGVLSVAAGPARAAALTAKLRAIPGVTAVTPDHARATMSAPNDPDYATAQAPYLTAVNAPAAWDVTHGDPSVKIAVVDTGVDVTHPDLAGKVVGTYNAVDGSSDVTDTDGHGTMVAGIAAAATDNGIGIAGAGYDTSILAVKVSDATGAIAASDVASGIVWAVDHGAKVIDISVGGPASDVTEADAVGYASQHGVLVVAAAGNAGSSVNQYPAGDVGVLAVGATDGPDRAADSNYGAWVDVGAPGVAIRSTVPTSVDPSGYAAGSGTSFAAPIVAGEAALLAGYEPGLPLLTLMHAIEEGTDQNPALGFAGGRVDFASALASLPPKTVPVVTAPSASQVSGAVTLAATTDASAVQFLVDGHAYGAPVPAANGSASVSWPTWGLANGSTHLVSAEDCALLGCGAASSPAVPVDVENAAPVVTSPTTGQLSNGTVQLAATATGGGVAFYIDGVRRAFDGTAPYAATVTLSAIADGTHDVYAVSCGASGAPCAGPSSATVSFTTRSLHPRITSVAPSPFSPNGDGRRDTTKVTYYLPEGGTTTYSVRNSAGQLVLSRGLGTLAAGWHNVVWKGRDANGHRVMDGTFTATITTSTVVSGVTITGTASRGLRVDDTTPSLGGVSGGGSTIYPYRDGYRDAFTPAVYVGEPATLTLQVRDSRGALVRSLTTTHAKAGRFGILWGGRTPSGRMVPAGAYRYAFVATDVAGNRRSIGGYRVYVSAKRLVSQTATVTQTARQAQSYDTTDTACANIAASRFSTGVKLVNTCDPATGDFVTGVWAMTVPSAFRYTSLRAQVDGGTTAAPAALAVAFRRWSDDSADIPKIVTLSSSRTQWWGLGEVAPGGHIMNRQVDLAVLLPSYDGDDDFDIASVRLTVKYDVLR